MVGGPGQVRQVAPGIAVAALIAVVVLGAFCAVLWRAGGGSGLGPADYAALRFTVVQAILSSIISGLLAVPVARALARRAFFGRSILITLLGAPFILPVIVAVLGLTAVFGRAGAISTALGWVGLPPVQIYGLHGVVLAHVFFNLPLATRILLQGWQAIPAERFRLAASLGMGAGQVARVLEYPMLRSTLPGALLIVFTLCLSSFAVALSLGGGPRATTVELAIYEAFLFDFDLGRAAVLASVQMGMVAVAAVVSLAWARQEGFGAGMDRAIRRQDAQTPLLITQDIVVLLGVSLFLVLPLLMILLRGLPGIWHLPLAVWLSVKTSLTVVLFSVIIGMAASFALSMAAVRIRWLEGIALLGIATSPMVIGTGLFLMIHPFDAPSRYAMAVTVLANALMALPFALRVMVPEMREIYSNYNRLSASLGMSQGAWIKLVLWPRMRRVSGFAAGLTGALSMGDLGVVALFASPEQATLPLQVWRLMGAYRMEDAAAAALLLMAASLAIFWLFDRGGRMDADT